MIIKIASICVCYIIEKISFEIAVYFLPAPEIGVQAQVRAMILNVDRSTELGRVLQHNKWSYAIHS